MSASRTTSHTGLRTPAYWGKCRGLPTGSRFDALRARKQRPSPSPEGKRSGEPRPQHDRGNTQLRTPQVKQCESRGEDSYSGDEDWNGAGEVSP